ncbi:MAG: UbiA family prenyltransferase [Planctomycetota bacterium]
MLFNYLRLVRFPYLFTALADVWAGYFIARFYFQPAPILSGPALSITNGSAALTTSLGSDFILCGIISICLYAAGMVFNDFVDLDKDAQFYPTRLLVTGVISPLQAFWLGTLLCLAAIFLSGIFFGPVPLTITFAIIILMIAYNFYTKSSTLLGSLNMGLLRGFNQLLGMTVWSGLMDITGNLLLLPLVPLGYIFFITLLSTGEETVPRCYIGGLIPSRSKRGEETPTISGWVIQKPLIFFIILSIAWPLLILPNTFKAIWLVFMMIVFLVTRLTARQKRIEETGKLIRAGVFLVIPLEASLVLGYGGVIEGLLILLLLIPALLFASLVK